MKVAPTAYFTMCSMVFIILSADRFLFGWHVLTWGMDIGVWRLVMAGLNLGAAFSILLWQRAALRRSHKLWLRFIMVICFFSSFLNIALMWSPRPPL